MWVCAKIARETSVVKKIQTVAFSAHAAGYGTLKERLTREHLSDYSPPEPAIRRGLDVPQFLWASGPATGHGNFSVLSLAALETELPTHNAKTSYCRLS
jgi:hypothetical protein